MDGYTLDDFQDRSHLQHLLTEPAAGCHKTAFGDTDDGHVTINPMLKSSWSKRIRACLILSYPEASLINVKQLTL